MKSPSDLQRAYDRALVRLSNAQAELDAAEAEYGRLRRQLYPEWDGKQPGASGRDTTGVP